MMCASCFSRYGSERQTGASSHVEPGYDEWLAGYDPFDRPEEPRRESRAERAIRYRQAQLDEVSDPDEWQWYHHHNETSSSEEQEGGEQPDVSTLRRRIMRTYRRQLAIAEANSDQEEIWRVEALMNEANMW